MRKLYNLLRRLAIFVLAVLVRTWLGFKSFINSVKAAFHPDNVLLENSYQGQKIILIALYEKGDLRNDIKRLLNIAKREGYYLIGVNTCKLLPSVPIENYFDCYIERYNFGRDFGSYKAAFLYLFKKGIHLTCPRLLMLNDSVFYESTRTPKFLHDLMDSEIEVLGATENKEGKAHLGSFCIALTGRILRTRQFIMYWERYKNTDLRPSVIERGERGLSTLLKKLICTDNDFSALYDVAHIHKTLLNNPEKVTLVLKNSRNPGRGIWPTMNLPLFWDEFSRTYYNLTSYYLKLEQKKKNPAPLRDITALTEYFSKILNITDPELQENMLDFIQAKIMSVFYNESQIHQNNPMLLALGLPIIKLDGYYRGIFSDEDIITFSNQLTQNESQELIKLLYSRPFGAITLKGIDKIYYYLGYI